MLIFDIICSFIIPIIMFIYSLFGARIKRNSLLGYRTYETMNDDKIWQKAQIIFSKLCFISSILLILVTIIIEIYVHNYTSFDYRIMTIIIVVLQSLVFIYMMVITNNKLKAIIKKDQE